MSNYKSRTNIVVSCWNALDHTKVTLQSLFDTVHHPYFLTIVDNGSVDGTREYLRSLKSGAYCENLTLIENRVNMGAGAAINQGQEVSDKYGLEFTCLCNNDLYFQDGWLLLLERGMDAHTQVGIMGTLRPAIDTLHHTRYESSKYIVDNSAASGTILEELQIFQDGYSFEKTCELIVAKNGGGVAILRCPPNAVVTCCALVRNSVSKKIGQFSDSQFELYGSEDIDLSWRLQKKGYLCAILKDVYVHHFRHRSISASNLNRSDYLRENNIKFVTKWKEDIFAFLKEEERNGADIMKKLSCEDDPEYFFLRRIRDNVDFMIDYPHENE